MGVTPLVFGIQAGLLAASFGFLALSLRIRDLVRAIGSFAAGSAALAASFFVLDSPFAGVLELTVGAGLVAVLFLVAITLTEARESSGGAAP